MKKLSKIRLQNAVVLEEREMKAIYGGSGGAGGSGGSGIALPKRYECSCNPGTIAVPWEGLYIDDDAVDRAIERNCGSGGGSCSVI